MKKLVLAVVVGLALSGCGKEQQAPVENKIKPVVTEADPTKRGVMALDAIYASEGAFMQHGMSGIEDVVRVLQHALVMWPETGDGTDIDACRMALRIQTTHMLNVMDRIDAPADNRSSQFRAECRTAVSYVYDDARIHRVWDSLNRTVVR